MFILLNLLASKELTASNRICSGSRAPIQFHIAATIIVLTPITSSSKNIALALE